jgi:CheY-like chemotaxis protein
MNPFLQGRVVLAVDDDLRIRSYMKTIFENEGIQVIEAREGLEALVLFHKWHTKVELVVTDIRMPCMTGTDLAVSLRSIRPTLPVVFVSGELPLAWMNDPKAGFSFVAKPFAPKLLLDAAAQLLAGLATDRSLPPGAVV